ncbi:MAG: alpha/beta hydrolase [Actinobacteria bacterium]|nr:alpha/beta hydrolase [Actinomycetota bacterium]NBT47552.1 alpha/beta hydrolase [Actinomycetota bacterium]NDE88987.1 alpha/beta hydrolase [Micrococcales bacterium]
MRKTINRAVLVMSIIAGLVSAGFLSYNAISQKVIAPAANLDQTAALAAPKTLAGFYAQKPVWKNCPGSNTKARCGNIQVPLDWSKPGAGAINIAVAVNPASNPKTAPYLLMNPGGPGGSGREWVTDYISDLGTEQLRNNYNIVGFDPRGVGASTSIKCYSASKLKTYLYESSPYEIGSDADINFTKKTVKDFGAACLKSTGALLGHVDTSSAAKDMDIIRAVLGSKKLNYLGFSYGTQLGITYASFFPKNVGRFVLDGVVDPTVDPSEDSLNQLRGFQSAMRAYLADCIARVNSCPFAGLTVDQAMAKVGTDFLSVLEKGKKYTSLGSRRLTLNSGFTGMIAALYSKDSWQYLTMAFNQFWNPSKSDGRIFLLLADSYFNYDQDTDSFGSNDNEAFKAISCLDSRESDKMADMVAQNQKALNTSPVFGRYWQYGGLACYGWPFKVVKGPTDYSAKDAPTMLVVGTTNDPATPYSQAVNVAHNVLKHGWLLTYEGEGHTAYSASNSCIASTVDGFLLNGTLPAEEKTCQ